MRKLLVDGKTLQFQSESYVMHCAYTCSPDGRWVAATWTDAEGELLETRVFTFWSMADDNPDAGLASVVGLVDNATGSVDTTATPNLDASIHGFSVSQQQIQGEVNISARTEQDSLAVSSVNGTSDVPGSIDGIEAAGQSTGLMGSSMSMSTSMSTNLHSADDLVTTNTMETDPATASVPPPTPPPPPAKTSSRSKPSADQSAVLWERVLVDIWNMSCQLTNRTQGVWRIIFCRVGQFSDLESKAWSKVLSARNAFPTGLDSFRWGTTPTPSVPPTDMASTLSEIGNPAASSPSFGYVETGLNVTSISVVSVETDPTFQTWPSYADTDFADEAFSRFFIDSSPASHCACSGRAKATASAHVIARSPPGSTLVFEPLVYSLHTNEDSSAVSQSSVEHPLSSADQNVVLTFIVQQLDAMSWLTVDPVLPIGRRSHLPLHCVVLARFVSTLQSLLAASAETSAANSSFVLNGSVSTADSTLDDAQQSQQPIVNVL